MTEETDVLDQADALMRRHRSFVASVTAQASKAVPTTVALNADSDVDIPLLTEVVDSVSDIAASNPLDTARVLDALRADIEHELSAWLVEELPAAVANASQSILNELDAKARHSLLPRLLAIVEARRAAVPQAPPNLSV
jgi:acetolactate synthase regulatory subunit